MFNVMRGGERRQSCVSYVQGDWTGCRDVSMFKVMEGARSVSHVQGDGRGGGRGASAM